MTPEQIIKTAEDCGFTRTHTGEVQLWLCNKTDLANFMHVISEESYHRGVQNGVVAGANNEREACADLCEEIGSKDNTFYREESGSGHCADAIRARGEVT